MYDFVLLKGNHKTREEGMCLLEAAAYLAGEPHSDKPSCVPGTIAAFGRVVNDFMDETSRQELKELLPLMMSADKTCEQKRSFMCADFACRQILPTFFDAINLSYHAATLRNLAPIVDVATARAARDASYAASDAAMDAASDAAYYAASDAAGYAATCAATCAETCAASDAAREASYAVSDAVSAAASVNINKLTINFFRQLCEAKSE